MARECLGRCISLSLLLSHAHPAKSGLDTARRARPVIGPCRVMGRRVQNRSDWPAMDNCANHSHHWPFDDHRSGHSHADTHGIASRALTGREEAVDPRELPVQSKPVAFRRAIRSIGRLRCIGAGRGDTVGHWLGEPPISEESKDLETIIAKFSLH